MTIKQISTIEKLVINLITFELKNASFPFFASYFNQ